ncbi:ORF-132 peptide [Chrysodeixis chalcites nucleopolyhedrovirus]|uniref:ORF-132 peptide n=1 Tax=Chrysodeixis chalcites nucleopolyhedrovirus TaxID=320432 RepID=Q4KSU9_9ABAC|nr:ORF-132 peptide [Chrysodeixis chalcites nucleopolyhedrovirus]AGC36346.1 hypothetical protein TF1A_00132 [Chrysodeixis chalcites SNPV TF1-A]AAY84063.1 ORF-132 peptide [Chrysodeixis chalcites nucleopolyhedrovirus]AGE61392.1 hypothetical protein [Chrysodeixis chalcites nucleopolyhedrovirus]AGE61538.1 hypothetical protein [Chrysodeixis chalcites nucleopolyhedrovirus]AGE61692.1 hypothetical protein [Chrysodeixis chalcites nucleopolyhedrovirus]
MASLATILSPLRSPSIFEIDQLYSIHNYNKESVSILENGHELFTFHQKRFNRIVAIEIHICNKEGMRITRRAITKLRYDFLASHEWSRNVWALYTFMRPAHEHNIANGLIGILHAKWCKKILYMKIVRRKYFIRHVEFNDGTYHHTRSWSTYNALRIELETDLNIRNLCPPAVYFPCDYNKKY